MTGLFELQGDGLHIYVTQEKHGSTVHWTGTSEDRDPAVVLGPYLKRLAEGLQGQVTVDFTRFGFMNSSTVPPIIAFLRSLNERAIATRVVYDGAQTWQRMSFNGLRGLSQVFRSITIVNCQDPG